MADDKRTIKIGGHRIELSNEDKVLFPDDDITKGDLIAHYRAVADVLLPHAHGRPLTLHRFPDGIGKDGFYQQKRSDYFPGWVGSARVERAGDGGKDGAGKDSIVEHAVCNDEATLVYLANQAAVTLHGWLSRQPHLAKPDRVIFDLDPPGDHFALVVKGARQVRDLMKELELEAFVMTTGSRGLHVVMPIKEADEFDAVRDFAADAGKVLASRHPEELTVEQRKNKRNGRLYLDVMRNSWGQTAVLPYCTRALPGAPVATPLDWDELSSSGFDARRYHLRNIQRRLARKKDPWSSIDKAAASFRKARSSLQSLQDDET